MTITDAQCSVRTLCSVRTPVWSNPVFLIILEQGMVFSTYYEFICYALNTTHIELDWDINSASYSAVCAPTKPHIPPYVCPQTTGTMTFSTQDERWT